MKKLLVQTQMSNYNAKGKWILEADSGFQMVMGRVRQMLKSNKDLYIDVMIPSSLSCLTHPEEIYEDLWVKHGDEGDLRLNYIEMPVIANALVTRYDFQWSVLAAHLDLAAHKSSKPKYDKYDAVYVNDPMHLRNLKAMFHVVGGYQPKFYVHSHFVDVPSCPKFPTEASLWLGQCEAAIKADWNFWQCASALREFEIEARKVFQNSVVDSIMAKSTPWDDGYSVEEITSPVNEDSLRFDRNILRLLKADGKTIIFVPNRIGGRGRSSDYTNCGKFMFDILPELRKVRKDYVVIAGNPSQKFLNSELTTECGPNGYLSLVPDSFRRDEFKAVASMSDIVVGLYDQDTYGGTAARECVELGCMPLWINTHEYSSLAREAEWPLLAKPDFSDIVSVCDVLIRTAQNLENGDYTPKKLQSLQNVVRSRCSYEQTTNFAMKKMDLLLTGIYCYEKTRHCRVDS